MEKARIQYLTDLHLSIIQIGQNTLSQLALYSCLASSIFEMVISLLVMVLYQITLFGISIHLMELFPTDSLLFGVITVISILIKLGIIIGIMVFPKILNVLVKQAILFLLSTCDQILFFLDSFLLGYMLDKQTSFLLIAGVNLILAFGLKILNQLIISNYSFVYSYQYKKMPTMFTTLLLGVINSLFVIFQIKMNMDIFMILFFVIAGLKLIVQMKFIYGIPYLNGNILFLKQAVFNNWICFTISEGGSYLFDIVCQNTAVLYIILYVFLIWINMTCIGYLKQKKLVADIQTCQNWEDINTKIQFSYQLLFHDQLDKMSTISKQHFQKCKIPTCKCRWDELSSPIDFRTQLFAHKSDIFQLKIFLKYYLLVLCQNFKERFTEVPQPWVVYISSLSLLNLYPKLIYYSVNFESLFTNQVAFSEKMIVNFLKRQILEFIEEKNNKDGVLQIQRIKKVQQLENSLGENIKKIADIKSKIWLALLQSPVEQPIIQKLFRSELDQRKIILETYQEIIKIPHKKLMLWRMMTGYCRNIIQDHNLQRLVRKNVSKEDLVAKSSEGMNSKEGSHPRKIQEFLNFQQNYCLLKIGTNEKKLGFIEWHNDNIYDMFGFSRNKRLVGQSISLLIPDIFKDYHHQVLKNWYQYPKTHKLNRLTQTYMKTQLRQFQSVLLYVKIITMQDNCGIFAILSQSTRERFLILDSDLNDVSNSNFIKDKLKSKISHHNLLLPLLSREYSRLKQFKGTKFQQFTLKFSLINHYQSYHQQYQSEIKAIDTNLSKEEQIQQRHNIIDKISTMISRTEGADYLEMQVLVKQITVNNPKNPVTYILVKQSVDEDIFNDENERLKKKRQNNNSTTFQAESSQNFHPNNTKTKQKKELDFQESESSISSTKNISNRDFVEKLKNKELLWLQKSLYICLFIYFLCELARLVELYYFHYTLNQIMSADVSVNTFVEYAESAYDNSLINSYTFSNQLTGVTLQKSDAFLELIEYNYDTLIELLKDHSRKVDNQWIKQFSSQFMIWISGNGVAHQFPVTVWFQTWGKINSMASKNTPASAAYIKLLNTNFPSLRKASHFYTRYYPQKAQMFISLLKYINLSILPINIIVIASILYFFNKYLNQKQKIRYDFIKIFTQIDQESIKSYANHYNEYQQQVFETSQQAQQFHQTGYLNRKAAINKAEPPPLYRLYMLVIGMIIIFDLITSISTYLKADNLNQAYKLSRDIKQSFHYEIQALIELKQISMGVRSYSQQISLQQVNDQDYNQFKDNVIRIFNQFVTQLSSPQNEMLKLVIGDVCDNVELLLPENLNNICRNQYSLQIIKAGTMTFSHYIVDVILQETQSFLNLVDEETRSKAYPDIITNVSLIDGSISLTYRLTVVQKIQNQISKIINSYMQDLLYQTIGMAVATIIAILIFISLTHFFKKKQNNDWGYIYGSLFIVPQKQLIKASTVSKLVTQLKDKSLK